MRFGECWSSRTSAGTIPARNCRLLIGAVRASSVLLDCTEEARVSSPQGQPEPLVAADSEAESATPEPEEPAEGPEDDPDESAELPATLDEEVPPALVGGLATEQMDDPFGDSERATARVEPEPPRPSILRCRPRWRTPTRS